MDISGITMSTTCYMIFHELSVLNINFIDMSADQIWADAFAETAKTIQVLEPGETPPAE